MRFFHLGNTDVKGKAAEKADPKKRMLSGGVFLPIFLFALPVVVGNFFLQLYVTVDAIIVGRYLGAQSLAAVSVGSPILFIVVFFLYGGCTGVSVLLAQTYGSGDLKKLKENMSGGLIFGTLFTLALTVVCLAGSRSVMVWTKVPPELHDEAMAYLKIVFSGLIFSFLYNYFASALRGIGNSRVPFLIQAAASCLHICINVCFVGVFSLGVRGSALATVLSQVFSSLTCAVYVYRREPALALRREDFTVTRESISKIVNYSWASALQSIIVYVGRFLTQGCVNPLGAGMVAGYNAATRVENFLMMTSDGVGASISTFIAQNLGAGHAERVRAGFRTGAAMILAYAVPAGTLLFINAPRIMEIFVSGAGESDIVSAGTVYLRPMAVYLLLSGIDTAMQSTFRGLGRFRTVMLVSLSQIIIRVILSFNLVPVYGIPAIAHSTGVGWMLIFFWLTRELHRSFARLPQRGA